MNPRPLPAATDPNPSGSVAAFRTPAEFECYEHLAFGAGYIVRECPQVFVKLVRAVMDRVQPVGFVNDADEEILCRMLLAAADLPGGAVRIVRTHVPSMWIRDWCPTPVYDQTGRRFFVGFKAGNKPKVAASEPGRTMAQYFGSPLAKAELNLEGGNLLTNGQGVFLTSTSIFPSNSERRYDVGAIGTILKKYLAAWKLICLKQLAGESTGHLDTFATFVSSDTVLVGTYEGARDAQNNERLDENARILSEVKLRDGSNLKVVRIPMPFNRDGTFRTYTNVIYANGVVLVPQFPKTDPETDWKALDLFAQLMPGWDVVGIDCSTLNLKNGALHCISAGIPAEVNEFTSPVSDSPFNGSGLSMPGLAMPN